LQRPKGEQVTQLSFKYYRSGLEKRVSANVKEAYIPAAMTEADFRILESLYTPSLSSTERSTSSGSNHFEVPTNPYYSAQP